MKTLGRCYECKYLTRRNLKDEQWKAFHARCTKRINYFPLLFDHACSLYQCRSEGEIQKVVSLIRQLPHGDYYLMSLS